MSSERIKVVKHIKDCGNGWCNGDAPCKGHTLSYVYNSTVDISTLKLDDQEIIGADELIDTLADMVIEGNKEQS